MSKKTHFLDGLKKGQEIKFIARRIFFGNPVSGKFIKKDDEFFYIELTKYIEGLSEVWHEGEEKGFRIEFCSKFSLIK